MKPLEISIDGIIEAAERVRARIATQLPNHSGLAGAVEHVVGAAEAARDVTSRIRRPFSLQRLPLYFLTMALVLLGFWLYWSFVYESTLTIAMPDRDTKDIVRTSVLSNRIRLEPMFVPGSREALALVQSESVDLAFVQGGMPIPDSLPRLRTPSDELVFWLTRSPEMRPSQVHRVITSLEEEGSHTVAKSFFEAWGSSNIEYVHTWNEIGDVRDGGLDPSIDAVFVVKDASDTATIRRLRVLYQEGFQLRSPYLGALAEDMPFLTAQELEPGYLSQDPPIPAAPIHTYRVPSFLVARSSLTPRLLGLAGHLFDSNVNSISDNEFSPTARDASDLFQGVEAFLGILFNIGLAFLALIGLDMLTYRKRFHELNSLVSLLSMLQSNKDVLGESDPVRRNENLLYLSSVSDILSIISAISGFYTQRNSSLLFNNLSQVVHERCDNLKLNIQMKILHAGLKMESTAKFGSAPII
jgi:hypothetical protein